MDPRNENEEKNSVGNRESWRGRGGAHRLSVVVYISSRRLRAHEAASALQQAPRRSAGRRPGSPVRFRRPRPQPLRAAATARRRRGSRPPLRMSGSSARSPPTRALLTPERGSRIRTRCACRRLMGSASWRWLRGRCGRILSYASWRWRMARRMMLVQRHCRSRSIRRAVMGTGLDWPGDSTKMKTARRHPLRVARRLMWTPASPGATATSMPRCQSPAVAAASPSAMTTQTQWHQRHRAHQSGRTHLSTR